MATCNNCLADVDSRVEIISNNSRQLACGACAVAIAKMDPRAEIRPFVAKQITMFVASDGWYSREPKLVDSRQRELDQKARRFAERVKAVVARRQASIVSEAA